MFVTLRGEPYLLWRAADEHGAELDTLLQMRREKAAAKRFFKRLLCSCLAPRKIVTDQLRSYPVAKADAPELANVKHVFVKAASPASTIAPRTAISQPENARGACVGFATANVRKLSFRASVRFGNTSR
ncbi:hypothetical protein CS8_001700 [Cupriavidus sp. 8B]